MTDDSGEEWSPPADTVRSGAVQLLARPPSLWLYAAFVANVTALALVIRVALAGAGFRLSTGEPLFAIRAAFASGPPGPALLAAVLTGALAMFGSGAIIRETAAAVQAAVVRRTAARELREASATPPSRALKRPDLARIAAAVDLQGSLGRRPMSFDVAEWERRCGPAGVPRLILFDVALPHRLAFDPVAEEVDLDVADHPGGTRGHEAPAKAIFLLSAAAAAIAVWYTGHPDAAVALAALALLPLVLVSWFSARPLLRAAGPVRACPGSVLQPAFRGDVEFTPADSVLVLRGEPRRTLSPFAVVRAFLSGFPAAPRLAAITSPVRARGIVAIDAALVRRDGRALRRVFWSGFEDRRLNNLVTRWCYPTRIVRDVEPHEFPACG